MTRIKTAQRDGRDLSENELLTEFLADRAGQRGDVMLSSTARSAKAKMSSRTSAEPDGSAEDGEDDDGQDGGNATGNAGAKRANGQKSRKLTKKLAATPDGQDDQEGEYAEDDNWSEMQDDPDGANTSDGKPVGALKTAKKGASMKADDGNTDDQEMDEELDEFDEGANMDGVDEELDADDDDSEAVNKYMPKADLTGPKAVTGRATAPLAGAGKHANVTTTESSSSDGVISLEEARTLREELAAARYQLHEAKIGKQLASFSKLNVRLSESQAKSPAGEALAEQQVAISKRFRDQYKKFMLSDGYRLAESTVDTIQGLIKTALEVAIVDLSRKGSSMDFEERKTIRASDAKNGSAQDQHLVDAAEMVAQRDYHVSLSELRTLVKEGDTAARDQMGMVYRRAAKESGYQGH